MKSGFDANVPKRKPRTRLGAMLAELDESPTDEAPPSTPSELGTADLDAALAEAGLVVVDPVPIEPEPVRVEPVRRDEAVRPLPEIEVGGTAVKTGRARIAELKARLDAANKRREEKPPEPEATASRVRETVAALSQRLEQTRNERAELSAALEAARRELGETQELLESEKKGRAAAEAMAIERQLVADELLGESEALAQERDRAMQCIGEMRQIDAQQAALLQQMEASLTDRDRTVDRLQAQNSELRAAVDSATADADAMQARLQLVLSERADLEARIGRLEAELARANSARAALGEIQKLVDGIS